MPKIRISLFSFVIIALIVLAKVGLSNSSNSKERNDEKKTDFLVTYMLEFVIDTASIDAVSNHVFYLYVGSNKSVFQNRNLHRRPNEKAFLRDPSTNEVTGIDASVTRLTSPAPFFFCIEKDYSKALITTYDRVFMDGYFYEEPMNRFRWHITGNEKSYLGYKVQEATTTYGCRDWVAWFTPDIPISDGPYKFHGLPGLILRLADTNNHYVFELEAIEPFNENIEEILEESRSINRINTSRKEFIRLRNNFSRDAGNLVGMYTTDPEIRARAAANAARRNNPIELCAD